MENIAVSDFPNCQLISGHKVFVKTVFSEKFYGKLFELIIFSVFDLRQYNRFSA